MNREARRVGENEALFRQVNAQMRALDDRLGVSGEQYGFLCECGNEDCAQRIMLSVGGYDRIHDDPARFVIVPGHEKPRVEHVAEQHDGYAVIRKDEGDPEEVAAAHEPR